MIDRTRVATAGIAAALVLATSAYWPRIRSTHDGTTAAQSLIDAAYAARSAGQLQRSWELLRDAWAAEPQSLLPLLELRSFMFMALPAALLESLDSIALSAGDPMLLSCVRGFLATSGAVPLSPEQMRHPLTRACADATAASNGAYGDDDAAQAALVASYPQSVLALSAYANAARWQSADHGWSVIERLWPQVQQPLARLALANEASLTLHQLERHDEAVAWEQRAEVIARDAGRGALAAWRLMQIRHGWMPDIPTNDTTLASHMHAVGETALTALIASGNDFDIVMRAYILTEVVRLLVDTGRLTDALVQSERFVAVADTIGDSEFRAQARARHGRALVKAGRLTQAETALIAARELALPVQAYFPLREVSHDLLHLYEAQGRYAEAVAAAADFAHYAELTRSLPTRMMAHHDVGWLHRRHGNVDAAQRAFTTMIAQIDTLRAEYIWAGEYYEYIGALELAREQYALAVAESKDRVRAFAGLMRVSEALGDVAQALAYARRADRDTSNWFPEYAPVTAGVLARNRRAREAATMLRRDIPMTVARGNLAGAARLALELAELELTSGAALAAAAAADTAALLAARIGIAEVEIPARIISIDARLRGAHQSRTTPSALAQIQALVQRGERMGMPQLTSTLHRLAGEALAASQRDAAAMAAFGRAADWVDSAVAKLQADATRAQYGTNHVRISNRALALLIQRNASAARLELYAHWSTRRKGGAYRTAAAPAAISRRLERNSAIVDYVVLDTLVAALLITDGAATLHVLPVNADSLRARVRRMRHPMAPRIGSAVDIARIGMDTVVARRLYHDLIAPLLPRIGARSRLLIIPDGVLHLLPFDALVSAPSAPPRYVLDDFTVTYLPSLDALRARATASGRSTVLLIEGPDSGAAPAAHAEVAAIRRALGNPTTVLGARSASEAVVRAHARDASILHFAAHAETNDHNPDFARLRLAADGHDDGWLHAYEIRSLPLDGALVVLSACETAAGPLAAGAGTLSLSRAFLQAGASATVATLWPVGEPTAVLMTEFHTRLAAGAETGDALRAARQALRARGYEHPFYWAPFTLTSRQP
ncbi:MAG TPA: CHAT domain-containing protein [Longimicrobiales bacterium]|nr:CHAT domain-containing protein [Longimicrobiales bacterium]